MKLLLLSWQTGFDVSNKYLEKLAMDYLRKTPEDMFDRPSLVNAKVLVRTNDYQKAHDAATTRKARLDKVVKGRAPSLLTKAKSLIGKVRV